jgi:hypothetical protein
VDLFQAHNIPVKGSNNNEDLQIVDRHSKEIMRILWGLGIITIVIFVVMVVQSGRQYNP